MSDSLTLIDSYEFASWTESENMFCVGSINDKLIITKTCSEGLEESYHQITSDGSIISISSTEN